MPIRITCSSCAKKLQVKDELLGKRVKCPACGTVLVVASEASSAIRAETPPQRDGKRGEPAAPKAPVKKAAVSAKTRPDRDEEDDEDERPRKRKKKAAAKPSIPVWIGVAVAIGLLVGGIGVYVLFFSSPTPSGPVAKEKGKGSPPGDKKREQATPVANGALASGTLALADLVPGDAWVFGTVTADLYNAPGLAMVRSFAGPGMEQEFQKKAGFPWADLERVAVFTVGSFAEMQANPAGPPPVVAVVMTKKPVLRNVVAVAFQNDLQKNQQVRLEFLSDQVMLIGAKEALTSYKAKKGQSQPAGVLARALEKASTSKGLVASVDVPAEAVPLATAALKDAPPFLQPLLKVKAALACIDVADNVVLDVALLTGDAAAAQEIKSTADDLRKQAETALDQFAKNPQMAAAVPLGRQALKDLKLGVLDKEFTVGFQANTAILAAMIIPAVQKVREAASNTQDTNNFKQIAIGWHNFHSTFETLPPQTLHKGLSWRVALLPYIEEGALFQKFKLDEPWDGPNNIQLLPLMPESYKLTGRPAEPGRTFIQTFIGPNTINKNLKKGMNLSSITDGTSNTLLFAEAASAVEWTKPDDIAVAPGQPITLGGDNAATFLAAFGDGHVQRLRRDLDQKTLMLLIDPADGNPVPRLD